MAQKCHQNLFTVRLENYQGNKGVLKQTAGKTLPAINDSASAGFRRVRRGETLILYSL